MEISRLIEGRASSNVISSTVDAPVREAIALLASKRIGAVPIMEGGRIVGIFSERDVIYRLADEGDACLERPIGEVMTALEGTRQVEDTIILFVSDHGDMLGERPGHHRRKIGDRSRCAGTHDEAPDPPSACCRRGDDVRVHFDRRPGQGASGRNPARGGSHARIYPYRLRPGSGQPTSWP